MAVLTVDIDKDSSSDRLVRHPVKIRRLTSSQSRFKRCEMVSRFRNISDSVNKHLDTVSINLLSQ